MTVRELFSLVHRRVVCDQIPGRPFLLMRARGEREGDDWRVRLDTDRGKFVVLLGGATMREAREQE